MLEIFNKSIAGRDGVKPINKIAKLRI